MFLNMGKKKVSIAHNYSSSRDINAPTNHEDEEKGTPQYDENLSCSHETKIRLRSTIPSSLRISKLSNSTASPSAKFRPSNTSSANTSSYQENQSQMLISNKSNNNRTALLLRNGNNKRQDSRNFRFDKAACAKQYNEVHINVGSTVSQRVTLFKFVSTLVVFSLFFLVSFFVINLSQISMSIGRIGNMTEIFADAVSEMDTNTNSTNPDNGTASEMDHVFSVMWHTASVVQTKSLKLYDAIQSGFMHGGLTGVVNAKSDSTGDAHASGLQLTSTRATDYVVNLALTSGTMDDESGSDSKTCAIWRSTDSKICPGDRPLEWTDHNEEIVYATASGFFHGFDDWCCTVDTTTWTDPGRPSHVCELDKIAIKTEYKTKTAAELKALYKESTAGEPFLTHRQGISWAGSNSWEGCRTACKSYSGNSGESCVYFTYFKSNLHEPDNCFLFTGAVGDYELMDTPADWLDNNSVVL